MQNTGVPSCTYQSNHQTFTNHAFREIVVPLQPWRRNYRKRFRRLEKEEAQQKGTEPSFGYKQERTPRHRGRHDRQAEGTRAVVQQRSSCFRMYRAPPPTARAAARLNLFNLWSVPRASFTAGRSFEAKHGTHRLPSPSEPGRRRGIRIQRAPSRPTLLAPPPPPPCLVSKKGAKSTLLFSVLGRCCFRLDQSRFLQATAPTLWLPVSRKGGKAYPTLSLSLCVSLSLLLRVCYCCTCDCCRRLADPRTSPPLYLRST